MNTSYQIGTAVGAALLIVAIVAISATTNQATPPEAEPTPTRIYAPVEPEETLKPSEPAAPETEPPAPQETHQEIPETRYTLTDEERAIVEAVVAAEAGTEDYDGQALVAQCILNTAEAKGMRPDAVVTAPKQYASPKHELRYLVEDAVSAVFDDGYTVTDEPIRYFYAPRWCKSDWHESLTFVLEHGGHRFFK